MEIINISGLGNPIDYLRLEEAAEPYAEDIASQAGALQHTLAKTIRSAVVAKRVFDVCVASLAIALLSPVAIAAAAAIKLDSRGPIFFVQERIGLNRRVGERRRRNTGMPANARSGSDRRKNINPGRPFNIYKFRTMIQNAEVGVPTLACENDPRITRVGRFLRKTRIDEIPQFINVIRGDMSVIGPRPERSFFINQVKHDVPEFTMRLVVKPGITGLAQVQHGYTKTVDEMKIKLSYDLAYIADISLAQEIKILLKTFSVVLTGKGAC